MKNRIILIIVSFLIIFLVGCPFVGPPTEEETAAIEEGARAKTAEGLDYALDAALTGDRTELDAFIAAEDVDGILAEAFDDYLTAPDLTSKDDIFDLLPIAFEYGMVVWYNDGVNDPVYIPPQPGDVLLFAADGSTWQNLLMSLVLVDPYFSHAGIVDPNLFNEGEDNCVLSATIDIGEGTIINGVTYQSLEGLKATNVLIIRLPYEMFNDGWQTPPEDFYPVFSSRYNDATTDYAFVTLDMNLDAITKEDPFYFYCSKVPWVVYAQSLQRDIEMDAVVDYYETLGTDPDARWTDQRQSLLYKLYKFFLWIEGARWWQLGSMADEHVKEVLQELVSPDELLGAFAEMADIEIP